MRSKRAILFLIMALSCFCIQPSGTPLAEVLPLVHSQKDMKEKAAGEHFNYNYHKENGIAIAHQNKFAHGATTGGINGHDPSHPNGASVIPLYGAAAGKGNNHHNRRSGGNHHERRTEPVATLAITTFVYFLLCNWEV